VLAKKVLRAKKRNIELLIRIWMTEDIFKDFKEQRLMGCDRFFA
jgi:hypothetical protein